MGSKTEIKLFQVRSCAELHGYRDVPLDWFVTKREGHLFGDGGLLGVAPRDAIIDYSGDYHGYDSADGLEEYFTSGEAEAFVAWLAAHRNTASTIEPVKFPIADFTMPFRGIAVGGEHDFLMIGDAPDYDLQFKVWGIFDVRGCTPVAKQPAIPF